MNRAFWSIRALFFVWYNEKNIVISLHVSLRENVPEFRLLCLPRVSCVTIKKKKTLRKIWRGVFFLLKNNWHIRTNLINIYSISSIEIMFSFIFIFLWLILVKYNVGSIGVIICSRLNLSHWITIIIILFFLFITVNKNYDATKMYTKVFFHAGV